MPIAEIDFIEDPNSKGKWETKELQMSKMSDFEAMLLR